MINSINLDKLNKNENSNKIAKAGEEGGFENAKDVHQAAIAIGKAETSMKLMLEIRNKALSAYKEISRTQI